MGLIGCGGRGSWIAGLFKEHGGYEFVAAADYFPDRAEKTGTSLGADKSKCFSGLSAYKRLIESGVEAVILETPPYFFPEHAAAAVEAGLHVYMAKPVAVDVPGTLKIGGLGKAAAAKKRVFLVDYQMPTDPFNIEVRKRLQEGGLGTLQMVFSVGNSGGGGFNDPPLGKTIESRLTGLVWVNDDAMGCGYIGNYDIHAIDAVIWALDRRPVSAYGRGARCRTNPHGDSLDTLFRHLCLRRRPDLEPSQRHRSDARLAEARIAGSLDPRQPGRGPARPIGARPMSAAVPSILAAARSPISMRPARSGTSRPSIKNVLAGNFGNETAQRSVDCTLTCILGREAARRGTFLTMDELIKENKRLEVDLTGLKS